MPLLQLTGLSSRTRDSSLPHPEEYDERMQMPPSDDSGPASEKSAKLLIFILLLILFTASLAAQNQPAPAPTPAPAEAESAEALRKAAQNPIASLVSVPVQNNSNFNVGPDARVQDILNVQPVIPMKLNKDWNLIARIITPIIYQPTVSQPVNQGAYGFGDLNPTFFISPSKPSKLIWGLGPAFLLPTATNPILGQGKWAVGPSVVLLAQPGKWTVGALVNNVFSFAGQSSRPPVNQMVFQYFINYNLKHGYFITWQPTLTANWEATNGGRWVVPYGGGVGRITKIGFQPVNLTVQFYGNAIHPEGTSPWSMRLQIAFLFPKLTKEQEKMMMEQKLKQMEQEQPKK
jgi:hypothetical protein